MGAIGYLRVGDDRVLQRRVLIIGEVVRNKPRELNVRCPLAEQI